MNRQPKCGLAVVCMAVLSVQHGQAADASDKGLEEIVVTARKVSEDIQTVPLSITALGGDAIRQQSIVSINDIQTHVPNLFVQAHPSDPQGLSFAIRGQKQNDVLLTLDPSVGLYVDGLYYPRTLGLRGALVDLDHIEVLRGPQGTLYGRNTTGGAVSIYTKSPTETFGASVELTAGNFGALNGTGIVNVPLAEGVALRVVAQRGNRDGYGRNALGRELNDEDSEYARAKLRVQLGSNTQALLWGSYQENGTGGSIVKLSGLSAARPPSSPPGGTATLEAAVETFGLAGLTPAGIGQAVALLQSYVGGADFYRSNATGLQFSNVRRVDAGLEITAELSDALTLRSITGHQSFERANQDDFDATPFNIGLALRTTDDEFVSEELQLLGKHDTFNWVTGLYAGREDGTDFTRAIAAPALNPANPLVFNADVRTTSIAGFVQGTWQFAAQWRGTLGLRWSEDKRELDSRNTTSAGCVVPAPGVAVTPPGASQCPRHFEDTFSKPSWLASLDYQVAGDLLLYVKAASGFRSGGQNLRGSNTAESFATFKPETIREYELGLKSEFLGQLRLNFAVFYDDYKDIQRSVGVATVSGAPVTIVTNAAQATVKGFEAEVAWQVMPRFDLGATTSLTDAGYDKFVDVTGDRTNEPFDVPEWTASLSARYMHPIAVGELTFRADYRWQDEVDLVPSAPTASQVTQESYALASARVALNIDAWDVEIALFGKNLTDEEYYVSGVSSEASFGYNYLVTGEPRTYGLQCLKRFGAGL